MRPSADVDRIVVIRPTRSGGMRAKEVYHDDLLDDDDDDEITVRILTRDRHGRRVVDYDDDDDRRRTSKRLRPFEKALRKGARRQARVANLYLALHDRSNRRKKNGWMKDFGRNVVKAYRRGLKLRFI